MALRSARNSSRSSGPNGMKKPSVVSAMLFFVLLTAMAVVVGVAIAVDDALWFAPLFQADAAYFDLYWDGRLMRLEPGSAGYDLLNEALHKEFPRVASYPQGVGLSDETLEALRREGRLLEVYYATPVRIHSIYRFSRSRVFYIPLAGHHARQNRVFNAARGVPLELRSIATILAASETVASW